jgi:hypothetical protein
MNCNYETRKKQVSTYMFQNSMVVIFFVSLVIINRYKNIMCLECQFLNNSLNSKFQSVYLFRSKYNIRKH